MAKIKTNAATVAAGTVDEAIKQANADIKKIAGDYTVRVHGQVGKLQLTFALKAREIVDRVPDADIKPLITAFGRQRKQECNAVVYASDADLMAAYDMFPKSKKPGLQQLGRALKLVAIGVKDDAAAKRYITAGKKEDMLQATGQDPEPEKPEGEEEEEDKSENKGGNQPGDTEQRNNPDPSEVGGLHDLEAAIEKIRKHELKHFGSEARAQFKNLVQIAEALIEATANG